MAIDGPDYDPDQLTASLVGLLQRLITAMFEDLRRTHRMEDLHLEEKQVYDLTKVRRLAKIEITTEGKAIVSFG